ncbi:MAG: hypothetical protein WD845_07745 [Pirellulales bacterium]
MCGEEIGRDATVDTHSLGLSGMAFDNKTCQLTMCAACAKSRRATQRTFTWVFLLVIGGLIVAALLVGFLKTN